MIIPAGSANKNQGIRSAIGIRATNIGSRLKSVAIHAHTNRAIPSARFEIPLAAIKLVSWPVPV